MEIAETIEQETGQKGFTMWKDIEGAGSNGGEPHLGNHAWPTMNNAMLTIVEDDIAEKILEIARRKDKETPALGLRAYVWEISQTY